MNNFFKTERNPNTPWHFPHFTNTPTLFSTPTPSLFNPSTSSNFVSPSSSLITHRHRVLDDMFHTLRIYVQTEEEAAAVRSAIGPVRCNLSIQPMNTFTPFSIDMPDNGSVKTLCFCMPGVERSTLNVELDKTGQILHITGQIKKMAPFTLTHRAPAETRFVTSKDHNSLDEGLLTICYTLESCRQFEKIY